jgi:hypothetical protein
MDHRSFNMATVAAASSGLVTLDEPRSAYFGLIKRFYG